MSNKREEGEFSVLDVLHNNWPLAVVGFGIVSIIKKGNGVKGREKLEQVVLLVVLVFGMFKAERVIGKYVITPALKTLFGDNDELRKKVEHDERIMRAKLEIGNFHWK